MQPALDADKQAHQGQDSAGEVGKFPGHGPQTAESLFGMAQTPRRQGPGCDQRESQPGAKGQHHGDAESNSLQLKTDQHDGEGRRTRQKAARKPEEGNLAGGHVSVGKSLFDLGGVGEFVRILISASAMNVAVTLRECHNVAVSAVAMR